MIVSDTIYHNFECCLRNMSVEDDAARRQRIAALSSACCGQGRYESG